MIKSLKQQIIEATSVKQVEELTEKSETFTFAPRAWQRKIQRVAAARVETLSIPARHKKN